MIRVRAQVHALEGRWRARSVFKWPPSCVETSRSTETTPLPWIGWKSRICSWLLPREPNIAYSFFVWWMRASSDTVERSCRWPFSRRGVRGTVSVFFEGGGNLDPLFLALFRGVATPSPHTVLNIWQSLQKLLHFWFLVIVSESAIGPRDNRFRLKVCTIG